MQKFLMTHKLPKNDTSSRYMNYIITNRDWIINQNPSNKNNKTPGPDVFTARFYQMLKGGLTPII